MHRGQIRVTAGHTRPREARSSRDAVVHDLRDVECRSTRAVMHDYLDRRLPARRVRRFESHMDGCPRCIRAFIDARQTAWTRKAAARNRSWSWSG
ncbi:hypothetical protein GCM10010102_26690 [Promicromonospora citrea]|uniref:Putative zinc-finger domain-containing protein n=1 Tax=Promicromonospora citrea TaxID=43677 RepID=A0A8H9GI13_9MICO|nr:hypothetical protein GCM10010102_26690 [Promicromonospora citrea]